jgi:histidyl-tRNA synthetase
MKTARSSFQTVHEDRQVFLPNRESMALQPPRGTRDFLPGEMLRREYVIAVMKTIFERYGFDPLETPAFEYWDLLARKGGGGDDIRDEIYSFRDKSNRELGLRFDFTVPLGRVVASNPQLPKPFKRYQIGRVWRYDRPQAGRYREFWQADADIVGSSSLDAEAECLAVAVSILEDLGLRDFTIRLNSRKILKGLAEIAGLSGESVPAAMRALDKLEKMGEKAVLRELADRRIDRKKSAKLMRLVKTTGTPSSIRKGMRKAGEYTKVREGLDELAYITRKCRNYGIQRKLTIDFSLVRGLDYYTGPIFEIEVSSGKGLGSVAGGGRYDGLVETLGGSWTPAVGIGLGIERIVDIMSSKDMFRLPPGRTEVYVAAVEDSVRDSAVSICQVLRLAGINAQTDLMGRNLKRQMEYADKMKIPYVLMVGTKELAKDRFTVKDMRKKLQAELTLGKLVKAFREGKIHPGVSKRRG